MPRATKAALASPNVVMLPTAAPRKVRNGRYKEQRQAARAAREAEPFPAERLFPGQRAAIRTAEAIRAVTQTPELLIALTIFSTMEGEARQKVLATVGAVADTGNESGVQALALLHGSRMTYGERVDLDFAFAYLERNGG